MSDQSVTSPSVIAVRILGRIQKLTSSAQPILPVLPNHAEPVIERPEFVGNCRGFPVQQRLPRLQNEGCHIRPRNPYSVVYRDQQIHRRL